MAYMYVWEGNALSLEELIDLLPKSKAGIPEGDLQKFLNHIASCDSKANMKSVERFLRDNDKCVLRTFWDTKRGDELCIISNSVSYDYYGKDSRNYTFVYRFRKDRPNERVTMAKALLAAAHAQVQPTTDDSDYNEFTYVKYINRMKMKVGHTKVRTMESVVGSIMVNRVRSRVRCRVERKERRREGRRLERNEGRLLGGRRVKHRVRSRPEGTVANYTQRS